MSMRRLLEGAVAVLLAACAPHGGAFDLAPPDGSGAADLPVYVECDTQCIRPSDCAVTYNDSGTCPGDFYARAHLAALPTVAPTKFPR